MSRGISTDPGVVEGDGPESIDVFDVDCKACPRLAEHLRIQRVAFPAYHNRPVAPFGSRVASLLIVGLAPGTHGANRTGRPFTGDYAGVLLYESLYRYGFANQSTGVAPDDGLKLIDCRITNAVKCLPPENKPETVEIRTCNHFLGSEIAKYRPRAVLTLGLIAHHATLAALGAKRQSMPFKHGAMHVLPKLSSVIDNPPAIFNSYHCSRYNTQTKRLTTQMFLDVVERIRQFVDHSK